MNKYILDKDHNPVACNDTDEWGSWFQDASHRIVAQHTKGKARVSTIFLGLDHNYELFEGSMKNYQPILFETMIFGGEHDEYQERYATWDEAVAGHAKALEMI